MAIAAKIDDMGKPAWIALMVLGFVFWWPFGLALLAFLIGSGRMGCWKHAGAERWHGEFKDKVTEVAGRWCGGRRSESSGNAAFDEYRADTLKRLEEEQREFKDFLGRLRHAKDKAEFDQFMADRLRRGPGPASPPQPEA
jgi:hypothetical protein